MDLSSSDDFDQLSANLPTYPKRRRSTCDYSLDAHEFDDFVAWQLNRFNRSSTVSVADSVSKSFSLAKKNCRNLSKFLPICQILIIILFAVHLDVIGLMIYVIMEAISMATVSSSMYSEPLTSKLKCYLSGSGFFAITLCTIRVSLFYATVKALRRRSTVSIITFILYFIISFTFFFQSPFVFEGRGLTFGTTIRFSLRLFRSMQVSQSIAIYITFIALTLLGNVSFGFTVWMAAAVKNTAFLSISGSAASSSTSHPTV